MAGNRARMNAVGETPVGGTNAGMDFGAYEDGGGGGDLSKCRTCGRTFASDRLPVHMKACKKSSSKRPVFNSAKQRLEDTDIPVPMMKKGGMT